MRQAAGPRPVAMQGGGIVTAQRRTPQQILFQMLQGLNPRVMANMLPSMKAITGSIVSGLGKPPEDFFEEVRQGAPPTYGSSNVAYGSY